MKRILVISALALALLMGGLLLPGPAHLTRPVEATHRGDIECPAAPLPNQDGSISEGEYLENFFDPRTKTLAYFTCVQDTSRTMHVALVTPWDGWMELRFQATDEWNGTYNVVRVSMREGTPEALDGFQEGPEAPFVADFSLGGSDDVLNLAAREASESYLYEFSLPLFSSDAYDSRLTSNGSFRFQLVNAAGESALAESDPQFLQIGQFPAEGRWTSLEMSLPPGNEALEPSEILVALRDDHTRPLPLRPLDVFARTTFGFLELGTVQTNEQGLASVTYTPRGEGEYLIGVAFAGEKGYLASVDWMPLSVTAAPPPSSPFPRDLLPVPALIVAVVGGVWGTYAYTLYLLRQARDGRGGVREHETEEDGPRPRQRGG